MARGKLTQDMKNIIMFSQFMPATVLGVATRARCRCVQASTASTGARLSGRRGAPETRSTFPHSGSVLERIAAAACPVRPADLVIEIGPGRGALTEKLLRRAARVVAVELDPFLADHLRRKFAAEPRLEVVQADVLETDLAQWGRARHRRQPALLHRLADSGETVPVAAPRAPFF